MTEDERAAGDWIECPFCGGDGQSEECACGDDSCCCLDPDFEPCTACFGEGGWLE